MKPDAAVDLLARLIETYAPSGSEEPVAKILTAFFEEHKIPVERDDVGNVIVKLGTGKPHLFLSSHMDTIPGELPFERTATHIKGRGAVDCRPALAAIAVATKYFYEMHSTRGSLTFLGVVREEDSLVGMQTYLKAHPEKPDFAFFGEPTLDSRVCVAYKGRIWIHLEVQTETGHVAAAWAFQNAIEKFIEIYENIRDICSEYKGASPFYQVIPTLATIHGGELSNAVPFSCTGDIDIRVPPNVAPAKIIGKIEEIISKFKEQENVSVRYEFGSLVPGYRTPLKAPGVMMLQEAIEEVTGEAGKLLKKTGTCFMNIIGDHYQTPTITYGPGNPRLEHTPDEIVEIAEYLTVIQVYEKFLEKFFAHSGV